MAETSDRMEMSLDQVIKKDWTPAGAKKPPANKTGGKSGGKAGGGRGKARGRGLGIRRNPAMTKVRRVPAAAGGKGKGRLRWVPKGSVPPAPVRQGQGRQGGKSQGKGWNNKGGGGGKGNMQQGRKGGQKGGGQRLWRGAGAARGPPPNGQRRTGGKGKGGGKQQARAQWDSRRVNRSNIIAKRSQKGKGKASSWKGGGKALAISNGSGYGKGKGKGGSKGKGYGGGGSWGQERNDRRDSWSNFEAPRNGGKGGRGDDRRAAEELTAEDKRMMKKITIVAQLDKVPRPHPAMQGLVRNNGKRSGGGDGGSLSSRFAANFSR